jgi:hypothetical protein
MLIYFVLLLGAMTPSLLGLSRPKTGTLGFGLYFLLLLIFLGFRFEVGPDWRAYGFIYDNSLRAYFSELNDYSEPGFFVLNKLSEAAGLGFQGVVFVSALFFLTGCFAYARTTFDPWMAITTVLPYLVYIIGGSGLRQSAAIGIGFRIVAYGPRMPRGLQLFWVAVAVSIHNSAVILLVLVLWQLKVSASLRVVLLGIAGGLVALNLAGSETATKYSLVYLEHNIVSDGAFFHVLLIAFPAALYLWNRRKIAESGADDAAVRVASYMALGALPLLAVSSTGADRASLYFSFVQMWAYPALIQARVASRSMLMTMVFGITFSTFFVYFVFGSHISAYVPYHNALFLD